MSLSGVVEEVLQLAIEFASKSNRAGRGDNMTLWFQAPFAKAGMVLLWKAKRDLVKS